MTLPKNWINKPLGYFFEFQKKSKRKARDGLETGLYKFFSSSSIQKKYLNDFDYNGEYLIFGTGGNASIHYCNEKFSTSTDCFVVKIKGELKTKYVYYYIKARIYLLEAGFRGAGLKHISKSYINELRIEFPKEIKTQEQIINILEKVEILINWRKKVDEYSKDLLKSVFIKMFGEPDKNPKGWKIKTIKEMCEAIVDCPHSTPKYAQIVTSYPCIRTSELKEGYIDWSSMKYLDEENYKIRVKRLIPREGDIVYGREGTFGEAIIIPENVKMSLGQRVMLFRTQPNLCTPEFLWSLIRSLSFYRKALRVTTGSTVGHVNVKDIIRFTGICPPLQLQKEYSKYVKRYNEILMTQKFSYQYLEDMFKSILQKAFKGELV